MSAHSDRGYWGRLEDALSQRGDVASVDVRDLGDVMNEVLRLREQVARLTQAPKVSEVMGVVDVRGIAEVMAEVNRLRKVSAAAKEYADAWAETSPNPSQRMIEAERALMEMGEGL